jgi:hypothetical protein
VHEARLERFVREGHASDAHQLARYSARRRRAILAATVADLEARLTDAVLDMADRLIGGLFARARNAARRRYAASAGDVGRLMRLFHGTIDALAAAQEGDRDAFEAVDEAVGWASCCGCAARSRSWPTSPRRIRCCARPTAGGRCGSSPPT